MEFIVATERSKSLVVNLEQDGNDVDIVVTDSKGAEHTIAYLNSDGLTMCTLDNDVTEIDTDSDGRVEVTYD